jgi:hypothetical protein
VAVHPDTRADLAVVTGGEPGPTNQRMEMMAAARAIAATPSGGLSGFPSEKEALK